VGCQAPRLFECVADRVQFETSRGRLTLPEVRAVNGGELHFFSDDAGLNQERLLFEARGRVVVDASRFAEEAFLRRYAAARPDVRLAQLTSGSTALFAAADGALPELLRHFEGRGIAGRAVRFEPASLPALLIIRRRTTASDACATRCSRGRSRGRSARCCASTSSGAAATARARCST
jgi:hypothetical protein